MEPGKTQTLEYSRRSSALFAKVLERFGSRQIMSAEARQHVWGQCWCGRNHVPHGRVENKLFGDVITLDFTKQLQAAGRAVGQGLGIGRIECKCGMVFDSAEAFNKHLQESPER